MIINKKYCFAIVVFILTLHNTGYSQKLLHDTAYYKTFPDALTVRIYSVKDYANFNFSALSNNSNLKYRPNTNVNLGLGATYNNVSLNLSAGFGFINKVNDDKGKTKSIDFQLHFFPRKWVSDLLYLHYKGFYAAPEGYASIIPNSYYYRPDIKMDMIGFTAYRNVNYRKFSFRSAFNQNEWIKKSAGTLLFGGGIYYQNIYSKDSSLIPPKVAQYFSNADFKNFHFVSIGPGIGYAYTLVIKKHFFLLGSAIINGDINFSTDGNGTINNKKTSFEPAGVFKAALGYGGNVWNVSLNWAGNVLLTQQANVSKANVFPSGNIRLMLAKQIMLKKPIPVINNIINGIFGNSD